MLAVAQKLAEVIRKRHIAAHRAPPRLPVLNAKWLYNWRRQYGVSSKHPCRKFKVSRAKAKMRCSVTTLNMCRVRFAFKLLYGAARLRMGLPAEPAVCSCDQKGLHYNESESKNCVTLALTGDDVVELKTNHAQSRSRMSLFTQVSTDPLEPPPVELLFKLRTGRVLRGLTLPPGIRVSVSHSASGSYAEEQVLLYLRRWLPDWSQEREQKHDYRVILLDAYTAHKTEAGGNI